MIETSQFFAESDFWYIIAGRTASDMNLRQQFPHIYTPRACFKPLGFHRLSNDPIFTFLNIQIFKI